jgi:hypothetical protein
LDKRAKCIRPGPVSRNRVRPITIRCKISPGVAWCEARLKLSETKRYETVHSA